MIDNIKCKICGSSEIISKFSDDERILTCKKCGTIFLSTTLTMEHPGEYYLERFTIDKYTNEDTKNYLRGNFREIIRFIKKFRSSGTVLDIGTNIGMFIDEANKSGYGAIGIEPSENLSAKAKELGIPVIKSTIEEFKPDRNFDIVTMFHVLEHLADPLESLKKINTMQKNGGLLVIEVPNIECYLAKKDGIFWKFIALEHLFYFSDKNINEILKRAGYKVIALKKRNIELGRLNIKKLFRYFWGKPLDRDRLFNKEEYGRSVSADNDGYKYVIRKSIIFLIKLLGREDHILVIAQKI